MSLGTANAAICDSLEDRPDSNNSRCIETFLFPDEGTGPAPQLRERVAQLAEQIDQQRKRVLAGYGMPASSTTDDILAHLVQLNTQRAAEDAQGRMRWLRPDFQNPQNSVQKQELLAQEEKAPEADLDSEKPLSKPEQTKPQQLPWHATLPEQVRAVAAVLAASPAPLTLPSIESRFKGRGPWKKGLPALLQTLEALGRAQAVPTGGEVA